MGRNRVIEQDSKVIDNLLREGNVENTALTEGGKIQLRTDVEREARERGNSPKILQISPTILG